MRTFIASLRPLLAADLCLQISIHFISSFLFSSSFRQLFRMNPVDMSDVADMIIGQSHVGCVIKQVGPDTSGTAGDPADEAEDRLGTNDRLGTEAEEADDTVYGVRGTSTPFWDSLQCCCFSQLQASSYRPLHSPCGICYRIASLSTYARCVLIWCLQSDHRPRLFPISH